MEMDLIKLIPSCLVILIAVIYVVGIFLKKTEKVNDNYITIILMVFSVVFAVALLLISGQYPSTSECIINGILQGILCWGVAVGIHQTGKQLVKDVPISNTVPEVPKTSNTSSNLIADVVNSVPVGASEAPKTPAPVETDGIS